MKRDEVSGRRVVVFGAALSGISAARLLAHAGAKVVVIDQKRAEDVAEQATQLAALGIPTEWGTEASSRAIASAEILVKSPGIPQTNPLIVAAREQRVRIVSEIEVAAAFLPHRSKLVAVTGTNGKTTTTAWIAHLLSSAGFHAIACANIGHPFSEAVFHALVQPTDTTVPPIFVAEVSSFQLEDIEEFHPSVAVLTNLAPDHLDRYPTYHEYVAAKENLLRNMQPSDAFVWNADNPDSASFAPRTPVRRYPFSASACPASGGAGIAGDWLTLETDDVGTIRLVRKNELPLPGRHNQENALAAALAAFLAGASIDSIREGLRTFRGVEHRIEFCGERQGVRFYNDSKATNLDSLEKALLSFTAPIVLIAGGRDKKSDYASLTPLIRERVKALITLGEAAPLIEDAWSRWVPSERARTMEEAVQRAAQLAQAGDVVLLSPACASYDMYRNFEERGRHFKECVRTLLEKN
jgi:UDP-N-acetylmuramoylalanine--D-glutamate ligase